MHQKGANSTVGDGGDSEASATDRWGERKGDDGVHRVHAIEGFKEALNDN